MLFEEEIQIKGVTYHMDSIIGEGTFGEVWSVSTPQGRKYALKIVKDYRSNPILKEMVDQEIATQEKFRNNDFVINIYGSKLQDKRMYIVFQLGTCSLRRKIEFETHIELRQFIDICLDTTKGIMAIHNLNFIHRDIKPENIICVEKTYKITDFGSLQGGTIGEGDIGTPLYLPPEILFNEEMKFSHKFDVWSLGVTLFETYFRIHPFFYLKECEDHKVIFQELKKNIKNLLPKFSMEKFVAYVSNFVSAEKVERIRNILLVTPLQIQEQFTYFFQFEEDRPDITHFVAVFNSLSELLADAKPNKVRLRVNELDELPSDIKLYVETLNLFYDLSFRYGTQKFSNVEFHLELGLWYWNFFNYLGQSYVSYTHYLTLKQYRKDKKILWQEVRGSLMDYYFEISSNKQLQFYSSLPILKVRVLLCGAMFDINPEVDKLLKIISTRIQMEVQTVEMLITYLAILEVSQLKRIQEILIDRYYY